MLEPLAVALLFAALAAGSFGLAALALGLAVYCCLPGCFSDEQQPRWPVTAVALAALPPRALCWLVGVVPTTTFCLCYLICRDAGCSSVLSPFETTLPFGATQLARVGLSASFVGLFALLLLAHHTPGEPAVCTSAFGALGAGALVVAAAWSGEETSQGACGGANGDSGFANGESGLFSSEGGAVHWIGGVGRLGLTAHMLWLSLQLWHPSRQSARALSRQSTRLLLGCALLSATAKLSWLPPSYPFRASAPLALTEWIDLAATSAWAAILGGWQALGHD